MSAIDTSQGVAPAGEGHKTASDLIGRWCNQRVMVVCELPQLGPGFFRIKTYSPISGAWFFDKAHVSQLELIE